MIDKEEIIRALKLWFHPGDVFEVRVLDAVTGDYLKPHVETGYFDFEHIAQAADALAKLRSYCGAYATVNPVNPDLLGRANNRLRPAGRNATTTDTDIVCRRWLLIDCDAVRPSGISSTDAEHEAALAKAKEIRDGMAMLGWPEPVISDSGNGAQLMYCIEQPARDGELVQRIIAEIAKASDEHVHIDLTVHNPARIWRIPGTMNCKGDSIPSRPHRMAKIQSTPEKIVAVTEEQLRVLAGITSPVNYPEIPDSSKFDLDGWIAKHCPDLDAPQPWQGGRKWVFPVCPFNEAHTNRSAVLIQQASGAIAFRCHHNGCSGNDWRKLRELKEPGCYERKEESVPDVDISGILKQKTSKSNSVSEPSTDVTDPGRMPERLLHIPGFVDEYTEFSLSTAPYPNRALSFCGALAFLSFLVGRKVRDDRDNRTNIYLVALANSGSGKDHPRKVNMNMAFAHNIGYGLAESFGSGEGLEDALFIHPSMLFEVDEFDTVFNTLKVSKDARSENIIEKLLRFYGTSNSVFKMRKLAVSKTEKGKAGAHDDMKIQNPHLVILGTAIPKFFYESLSKRVLENGLIARCMVIDAGKRGHGQKSRPIIPPDSLSRAIDLLLNYGKGGDLGDLNPQPMTVPNTPEAEARLVELNRKYDLLYDRYEKIGDCTAMALWARAFEKVCKLAMLYGISANPVKPLVTLKGVGWAEEFVEHLTKQMLFMVDSYSYENIFDEKCQKIIRYLRSAGGKMGRGELLKRSHEPLDVFMKIIATLEENGTLTHSVEGEGNKRTQLYHLR